MTTYNWIVGSGFWSTATKWSPAGTPSATDSAVISATGSAYGVNINAAAFANGLTESSANATVNDLSSLTLGAGGFALSAGAFNLNNAATLTVGGTFAISGAAKFTLNGGGTLAATTTTITGGTINWAGGTVSGGTIDAAALNLTVNYASVHFANGVQVKNAAGTGAGSINLTGFDANLYFDNTQTFNNATISFGNTTGYESFIDENDANGSGDDILTLGSGVTINVVGTAQIDDSGYAGDGVVNQGIINDTSGAALNITATNFTNQGTINVANATSLNLSDLHGFSNTGTIKVDGTSSVTFNYELTTAQLGTLVATSGATINFAGILENAGATYHAASGVNLSGDIDGGVIDGPLNLTAQSASLALSGGVVVRNAAGTGPGTINVTGLNAYLYFANTQTFNNAVINLGFSGGGYYSVLSASGADETLTLGSGITTNITGSAYISDNGYAGDGVVNQGTINDNSGAALNIDSQAFTNQGTINVANASSLTFSDAVSFSNAGTISVDGTSTINFSYELTTAQLGTIAAASGATLDFAGILNNVGATYNVAAGVNIGGAIDGGVIDGTINLSAQSQALAFYDGPTLYNAAGTGPGTINVLGYNANLYFDNTQTFDNATINLGSTAGYYAFLTDYNTLGGGDDEILTLGSGVVVDIQGSAYISDNGYASKFVNQGVINDNTGYNLVVMTGGFANQGTINVANAAGLSFTDPTFVNTGTINVDGVSTVTFNDELTTAQLGTVVAASGATLDFTGILDNRGATYQTVAGVDVGGAIDGGTIDGLVDLSFANASLAFYDGPTVNNAAGTGPGTINVTGDNAYLYFDNTETLNNATINIGNTSGNYDYLYEYDTTGAGGQVVTLGSGVTINILGYSQFIGSGAAGDAIVNQGVINDSSGFTFTLATASFTNQGAINVANASPFYISNTSFSNTGSISLGGADESLVVNGSSFTNNGLITLSAGASASITPTTFTNLVGSTLTGGSYVIGADDVLELNNNTKIVTLAANITLSGTGSLIQDYNTTTNKQSSFDFNLRTIGATGQLHVLGGRNFVTAAAAIADNGLLELGGGTLAVSGAGSSFAIGATGVLMGFGTASAATFTNAGRIEAAGGTLTLQQGATGSGGYQIDAGATLELDGATASGTVATFNGAGAALTLAAPSSFASTIGGLGFNDRVNLMGLVANAAALNGSNQLVVSNNGATVATLQLSGANGGFAFLTQAISGGTAVIALPVPPTVAQYLAQPALYDLIPGGFAISDTAAAIAANIGQLLDSQITGITATSGVVSVSVATFLADRSALDKIGGGFAISDTAADISAQLDALGDANIQSITISDSGQVGASVAQLTSDSATIGKLVNAGGGTVQLAVTDSATDIQSGLSTLEADVGEIASITVSSGTVAVSAASFLADQSVLDKIGGGFTILDSASVISGDLDQFGDANIQSISISDNAAVGASIAQLTSDAATIGKLVNANASAYQLAISDNATHVSGDLDGLQASLSHIASITISDNAAVAASVAQLTNDAGALAKLADANATPYQLAIVDTAADVQNGLSTLVADTSHIASITASGGLVTVSTGIFGSARSTLDKIFGGFEVSDTAPNIVAALSALNGDAHLVALAVTSGTATLGSGATINAASLSQSGGSTLTIAEPLTYAGALAQGAGTTIAVGSGDTLTLKGASTLAGTVNGVGALALTAGSTTIASGAKLATAKLSITGTAIATLNENLAYAGGFTGGFGATLSVSSGDIFTLTGTAALAGSISGAGALTISGGATTVSNTASFSTAKWSIVGATTNVGIGGSAVAYGGGFTLGAGATATIASKDLLKLTGASSISGTIAGAGTLVMAGGTTAILSGAAITAANWSLLAAGATSIGENLSYGGNFTQAAVPTLGVGNGQTFTLSGTSALSGLVAGLGTLALSGGTTTLAGGAALNVAHWSVTGGAVTIAKNLAYGGAFTASGGATLTLSGSGAGLTLQGKSVLSGATINGAGLLTSAGAAGSTAVAGLTLGGSVAWNNIKTITENGGSLTLGDSSGGAAKLTNAKAGVFNITDDSGIASGASAASIANVGLLEKTAGQHDSVIAPNIANTGTIRATSGELEIAGALTGAGSLQVGGGANLQLDGSVASTQTLSYAAGQGVISLADLDVAGVQLFHGAIHGWAAGDKLDVGTAFGAGTLFSFVENGGHSGGVLNLSDNGATAAINFNGLSGIVSTANFSASLDGSGATVFAYHT